MSDTIEGPICPQMGYYMRGGLPTPCVVRIGVVFVIGDRTWDPTWGFIGSSKGY